MATEYDDHYFQQSISYFQQSISATVRDEADRRTSIELPSISARARWDISPTCNFTDTCMDGTLSDGAVSAYIQYMWPRRYLDHLLTRAPYATPPS